MNFNLTLNEFQAKVMVQALDVFSRIGIGQLEEIESLLRRHGHNDFNYDAVKDALNLLKQEIMGQPPNGSFGIHHPEVHDVFKVSWDLQQVVRYCLAWSQHPEGGFGVNFYEPSLSGSQPLATIELVAQKLPNETN